MRTATFNASVLTHNWAGGYFSAGAIDWDEPKCAARFPVQPFVQPYNALLASIKFLLMPIGLALVNSCNGRRRLTPLR